MLGGTWAHRSGVDMSLFDILPEVQEALRTGKPVVALESTIISHGMPYPENVETALAVEAVVRAHGAVPATVAMMDQRVKIGLSPEDLEAFGRAGRDAVKASRRDVASVLSQPGLFGATTVSATMVLASRAGIAVFVTGGIGGVHMDGENSMDVSADLVELGRTSMLVVSAGVKSILDIGRTLEVLETQGVTVVGYGVDDFPAFFVRESGFPPHMRLDTAEECAGVLAMNRRLQMDSGILVGAPVPEEYAADKELVEEAIAAALAMAEEKGISGKEITPFLLAAVAKLTGGNSLQANIALVKNNAAVGAGIAVAYSRLGTEAIACDGLVT